MKGCYVLSAKLAKRRSIVVGSLGSITFQPGYYAYIGSALGGFKPRMNRHLRKDKLPKWHIDYLLQEAAFRSMVLVETEARMECRVAEELSRIYNSVPRFGSSDCRCPSHLFYSDVPIEAEIMAAFERSR